MPRNPRDWLTLAHIGLAAGLIGLALAHSWWWAPLAAFVAAHAMAIEHNHAHLPIFAGRAANRLTDLALVLVCGIPMFCWRVHHLGSHHAHTWTDRDWSSPFSFRGARSPDRPVPYRYYQLTYYPLFVFHSAIHVLRSRNPRLVRGMLLEAGALLAANLTLLQVYGILRWLAAVGGGYLLAGLMLGAVNYFEHYATHDAGERFLAWTFTCRLHNLLSYNSGYHLLHHLEPTLHWSELPAAWRRREPDPPAGLVEHGLFPGYRLPAARGAWFRRYAEGRG